MRTLFLIVLSACAPTVLSATPRSITMENVNKNTIGEATRKAQAHCRQYGRDAELVPDSVPDGTATFRCVDPEKK